jgi:hypothetical protein
MTAAESTENTPIDRGAIHAINRTVEDVSWRLVIALTTLPINSLPPSYLAAIRRLLDQSIALLEVAAMYLETDKPDEPVEPSP